MLVNEEEKECLGGGTWISVSQIAQVVDFHRVFLLFLICATQLWGGGGWGYACCGTDFTLLGNLSLRPILSLLFFVILDPCYRSDESSVC